MPWGADRLAHATLTSPSQRIEAQPQDGDLIEPDAKLGDEYGKRYAAYRALYRSTKHLV